MPCHLLHEEDHLFRKGFRRRVGFHQFLCKIILGIVFLYAGNPLRRDIADGIDIPEYRHRIAVPLKGFNLEGGVDQRIGTGKGVILCPRKQMILSQRQRNPLHHLHQCLSDTDAVGISPEFLIALHGDLSGEKPARQMVQRPLFLKPLLRQFCDLFC